MAKITASIKCRIYGTWLATQVGLTFRSLGFSEVQCLRAAKACLIMRTTVGRKSSWQWGGNWVIDDQ